MPESKPRANWTATPSQVLANLKKNYGDDLTTEFVVNPAVAWRDANSRRKRRLGQHVRNRLERLQQQL